MSSDLGQFASACVDGSEMRYDRRDESSHPTFSLLQNSRTGAFSSSQSSQLWPVVGSKRSSLNRVADVIIPSSTP